MERLTYDFSIGGNHCWQVKGADNLECREVCQIQGDKGCEDCPIAAAFDRLAAYEDTGFTPEEVQQMRWIPVEERLPETTGKYLILDDEKEIYEMEFDEDIGDKGEFGWWTQKYSKDGWAGSDWTPADDITHWMPLPKAAKEESNEQDMQ